VIDSEDALVGTTVASLAPAEAYDGGRFRFDGTVALDHSGAFGYTVRVIPKNSLLASTAELGVVALPA
jgi:starch phosphorylase